MRSEPPLSGRGGRSAAAVALLALIAFAAVGCASAPSAEPARAVSEGPFAFRDPRDGAPPPPLSARDSKALDASLAELRRGDVEGAGRTLAGRRKKAKEPPSALALADAYLRAARGGRDEARESVSRMTREHPTWVAAVELEADLALADGRAPDALERYRSLLRLVPSDRRARERVEALRAEVAAAKTQEAEAALAAGDLDAARRSALSLIQLEPASAAGYLLLSRAAAAGGKNDDAWTWAREARRQSPADRSVSAFAAEAAARAGRWSDAATLYQGLAASDPAFVPKAEEARVEFRVQNLPEAARRAAESPRLTRSQLATLLWWSVPELRDALVPPGAEIAVDVVDRPDRAALVRAIGLGFLSVSPETHRVGADAAVSRSEMAAVLRRAALLAGRGRPPAGCLAPEVPSASALQECGILSDTSTRHVTGREALRALEKAGRVGREGGTR